jgi:hypothetical protein
VKFKNVAKALGTTTAKTFGPTRVSIDGCDYVDAFLEEIKKKFEISGPSSHLNLHQLKDGKEVEIEVGGSLFLLVEGILEEILSL